MLYSYVMTSMHAFSILYLFMSY